MDPESSYPIPDKQIAQSSSSKVIEDQSGHLDSQQQLQQRKWILTSATLLRLNKSKSRLIEDTLPDHELDDDHLPPKHFRTSEACTPANTSNLSPRPSSAGQDLPPPSVLEKQPS
jgi:hypothetical protein